MTTAPQLSNHTTNGARAQRLARYQYKPMATNTCVRLLQLASSSGSEGGKDDTCSGKLVFIELRTMCRYEALSYVWGLTGDNEYIIIDVTRLQIRANLADALRDIRTKSGIRTVWIDAICINQHDVLEWQEQVRSMAYIYRSASQLLVHLGGVKDFFSKSLPRLTDSEKVCAAFSQLSAWQY